MPWCTDCGLSLDAPVFFVARPSTLTGKRRPAPKGKSLILSYSNLLHLDYESGHEYVRISFFRRAVNLYNDFLRKR